LEATDLPNILSFLNSWPYDPDDNLWIGRGRNGRDIMLVRQPMGLEVYEVKGRPDGQRPHGMESELDFHLARLALDKNGCTDDTFHLTGDDCQNLFSEATIYYHRFTNFFRLKDWTRAEHDRSRILCLCDFVERYAPNAENRGRFEKLRLSATRMSVAAHAMTLRERSCNAVRDTILACDCATNGITHFGQVGNVAPESLRSLDIKQPPTTREEALFMYQGDYWNIAYHGNHAMLKATRGLRCLACLLRYPAREFHVRELVAFLEETPVASLAGETGAILDSKAKAEYKLRLDDLRSDLAEAERFGDEYRAAKARAEIDLIAHQLAAAVGLGGRDRRAPSDAERARSTVTKRIKEAINRIGKAIPVLGRHLATQVKTGYYCSYTPDPDRVLAWKL
jgi:hypothetical protein